tara:strand:+ start:722 stop:916 length:195 start_codon:yes stop_codon:yes gene_type:complete
LNSKYDNIDINMKREKEIIKYGVTNPSNKYRKKETPITPPIIGPITGIHEYDQLEFPFPGIGKM